MSNLNVKFVGIKLSKYFYFSCLICRIYCDESLSFLILVIYILFLPFFINLARDLSILLAFSKIFLLALSNFSVYFLISTE